MKRLALGKGLFAILILLGIVYYFLRRNTREGFLNSPEEFMFIDESYTVIDHTRLEQDEQELARRHILPTDSVLELGARYGTVTCTVNRILHDKKNHVCVEPDEKVWGPLETNKQQNRGEFTIVKGFVSKKQYELTNESYASTAKESSTSTIPSYPFEHIQQNVAPFTVLIADCEGCLESFLDENPSLYRTLRMVQFETDQTDMCNYDRIIDILKQHNFRLVDSLANGAQQVWIKE